MAEAGEQLREIALGQGICVLCRAARFHVARDNGADELAALMFVGDGDGLAVVLERDRIHGLVGVVDLLAARWRSLRRNFSSKAAERRSPIKTQRACCRVTPHVRAASQI